MTRKPARTSSGGAPVKLSDTLGKAAVYSDFMRERIQQLTERTETSPATSSVLSSSTTLLPHQVVGVNWLLSLYENGVSGILADEMGLGKTVQILAFLGRLIEMRELGPHVIVCPLSTLENWRLEAAKWLPHVPVAVLHGDSVARRAAKDRIGALGRQLSDAILASGLDAAALLKHGGGIVLTTYEVAVKETTFLSSLGIRALVVDEGQRLKNFQCQLVTALKTIPTEGRFLLTGTPVQNSLAELWSLLNFVAPDVFASLSDFEDWFNSEGGDSSIAHLRSAKHAVHSFFNPRNEVNTASNAQTTVAGATAATVHATAVVQMHRALRPFILRRLKSNAGFQLPPLIEVALRCPLSRRQQDMYLKATRTRKGAHRLHMTQLRLLCGHPYLVRGGDPFRAAIIANKLSTRWPHDPKLERKYYEALVNDSGKLKLLQRLLSHLLAVRDEITKRGRHRVLIFSQFALVLDVIEELLAYSPIVGPDNEVVEFVRLDGSHAAEERSASITAFNDLTGPVRVFLLSTRAGGLGINLTAADTVVIFDGDFNPHNDVQAISRAHRLGQTRPVAVFRLVAMNTIEETILQFGIAKLRMEKVIIDCGQFSSVTGQLLEQAAEALRAEEQRAEAAVKRALEAQMTLTDASFDAENDAFFDHTIQSVADREALLQRVRSARDSDSTSNGAPVAPYDMTELLSTSRT
jgi:ATP-dependent DNA helicase